MSMLLLLSYQFRSLLEISHSDHVISCKHRHMFQHTQTCRAQCNYVLGCSLSQQSVPPLHMQRCNLQTPQVGCSIACEGWLTYEQKAAKPMCIYLAAYVECDPDAAYMLQSL